MSQADAALNDQYAAADLGDHEFDPELDTPLVPASPAKVPKDPKTGRFTKQVVESAQQHSKSLSKLAKDYGFSDEEIAESSSEQLHERIHDRHVERQRWQSDRAEQRYIQNTPDGASVAQTPVPQTSSAGQPQSGKVSDPSPESEPAFDRQQYDDGLVKVLDYLLDKVKEVGILRLQVAQHHGHIQGQIVRTATQQYDEAYARHPALFGTKSFDKLDKKSPEMLKRYAIHNLITSEAFKGEKGTIQELVDKATGILFGTTEEEPPQTPIPRPRNGRPTPEEWDSGGLARPTQRSSPPEPKGTRRAERAVSAKMRESGFTDESFEGLEEQGLPP